MEKHLKRGLLCLAVVATLIWSLIGLEALSPGERLPRLDLRDIQSIRVSSYQGDHENPRVFENVAILSFLLAYRLERYNYEQSDYPSTVGAEIHLTDGSIVHVWDGGLFGLCAMILPDGTKQNISCFALDRWFHQFR